MSDINKKIRELVNYGLHTGLVVPEDEMYTINRHTGSQLKTAFFFPFF